jgi:hypothetical protein
MMRIGVQPSRSGSSRHGRRSTNINTAMPPNIPPTPRKVTTSVPTSTVLGRSRTPAGSGPERSIQVR